MNTATSPTAPHVHTHDRKQLSVSKGGFTWFHGMHCTTREGWPIDTQRSRGLPKGCQNRMAPKHIMIGQQNSQVSMGQITSGQQNDTKRPNQLMKCRTMSSIQTGNLGAIVCDRYIWDLNDTYPAGDHEETGTRSLRELGPRNGGGKFRRSCSRWVFPI